VLDIFASIVYTQEEKKGFSQGNPGDFLLSLASRRQYRHHFVWRD
jgi:hypothetical protein